jgi:hypothetical protein
LQVATRNTDFLGIAELLARLDLAGGTIVEFPATLQVRVLGHSKMRVLGTILGHLGLLVRLTAVRMTGGQARLRPKDAMSTVSGGAVPTERQGV